MIAYATNGRMLSEKSKYSGQGSNKQSGAFTPANSAKVEINGPNPNIVSSTIVKSGDLNSAGHGVNTEVNNHYVLSTEFVIRSSKSLFYQMKNSNFRVGIDPIHEARGNDDDMKHCEDV